MHEWGLAKEVIDTVASQLSDGMGEVVSVSVVVGPLAGVTVECLAAGFDELRKNTCCAHSVLNIEMLKNRIVCVNCGTVHEVETLASCANCGNTDIRLEGGTEFFVSSIEIDKSADQE